MNRLQQFYFKYIKNNPVFERFVKIFSVDVLVRGGGFFLLFIFIQIMPKEEFGVYTYIYSFAMTACGIMGFGLFVSMTKLYADTVNDRQKQGSMLFTLTTTVVVLLIGTLAIIYFTKLDVYFFSFQNRTAEAITASMYDSYRIYAFITIISMVLTNYLTFYFVSSEKIKYLQSFNLLRFFLANGAAIVIILNFDGDKAMQRLAATYLTELLLTICFSVIMAGNFTRKFSLFYLKKGFIIGFPVMISSVVYSVMTFGDKFFVMKYFGSEQSAVYNFAILIASILPVVFQSFNFVWLPLFLKEKDLLVLRRKTTRYIKVLFLSFLALSALIWAGIFVGLKFNLIKEGYSDALEILPVLFLSQVFAVISALMINYMIYFEKTYIQVFVGIVMSFAGYFLYDYGTLYLGILGTGLALLLLNVGSFIFYYLRANYYINNRLKA